MQKIFQRSRHTLPGVLTVLACVFAFPKPMLRAESAATSPATQSTYYPTRLTLHPSAATQPASQYNLLPAPGEQTAGNAVTLYLLARRYWPDQKTTNEALDPENRRYNYLDTPIDQFPKQYAQRLLEAYSETLAYVDLGARRREAIWDTGWRERGLGVPARFAYIDDLRHAENLLSFRARLEVSQHDWRSALHTVQTEFSLARQMQTEPLLIHSLVASGFGEITLSEAVGEWVSRDGSPNLYWSLTELPRPFVELRAAIHDEDFAMRYWRPRLWEALHGQLSTQQWPQAVRDMVAQLQASRPPFKLDPPALDKEVKRLVESSLPRAKQYLVSDGVQQDTVNAMAADQAVGEYFCRQYNLATDELLKVFGLPYSQAEQRTLRAWRALRPDQAPAIDNPLIQANFVEGYYTDGTYGLHYTIPRPLRLREELIRPDRLIALMRTIEALRDYAARHEGQPPERLEQITDLPLPVDPMTEKPFSYQLNGRTATLDAPPPFGRTRYSGWTYELTFAK